MLARSRYPSANRMSCYSKQLCDLDLASSCPNGPYCFPTYVLLCTWGKRSSIFLFHAYRITHRVTICNILYAPISHFGVRPDFLFTGCLFTEVSWTGAVLQSLSDLQRTADLL